MLLNSQDIFRVVVSSLYIAKSGKQANSTRDIGLSIEKINIHWIPDRASSIHIFVHGQFPFSSKVMVRDNSAIIVIFCTECFKEGRVGF